MLLLGVLGLIWSCGKAGDSTDSTPLGTASPASVPPDRGKGSGVDELIGVWGACDIPSTGRWTTIEFLPDGTAIADDAVITWELRGAKLIMRSEMAARALTWQRTRNALELSSSEGTCLMPRIE
ncbi:hypothetical protein [Streptomyces mesophilus]|uniref:hypothetical protein n=1 Tax=Streptomyces mesophilus TaxID=1775132 RepID=UPI003322FFCB